MCPIPPGLCVVNDSLCDFLLKKRATANASSDLRGNAMILPRIVSLSIIMVLLLTIAACGGGKAAAPRRGSLPQTNIQLDSAMKAELLALANNRDEWFLASDITTEALEGLYDSWSVICRNETSLADYKGAVYEVVRPWVLEMTKMELKELQGTDRYYNLESWTSPWAYVEQTWKLDDKIVFGPQLQLYLIESGAWRYHDC